MRTRSLGLTLFSGLAILLSACSNTGSGASAGASAAPDPCAGAGAGPAHTQPTDWSKAKIGVATDIGTLDDKNYNEYTYKGAQAGATDLKAREPAVRRPEGRQRVHQEHPVVRRPELRHHRHGRASTAPPRRRARPH